MMSLTEHSVLDEARYGVKETIVILDFFQATTGSGARSKSPDALYRRLRTSRRVTDYLFNISVKKGYLYVETPKVACSTIKRSLQLLEVGPEIVPPPRKIHERSCSPLLTPSQVGSLFLECAYSDNFFRFCFVRNPYTRILSCYLDKVYNQYVPWVGEKLSFKLRQKIGRKSRFPAFRF